MTQSTELSGKCLSSTRESPAAYRQLGLSTTSLASEAPKASLSAPQRFSEVLGAIRSSLRKGRGSVAQSRTSSHRRSYGHRFRDCRENVCQASLSAGLERP